MRPHWSVVIAGNGAESQRQTADRTWATAPQPPEPEHVKNFRNQTLRLIVHISTGGTRVRIKISNTFGDHPLVIGGAQIARRKRPEGPIFFANAAQIAHKIEPLIRETQPKVVAVDASGVLDMEYTALKMFAQIAETQSQHRTQMWLIGMSPRVLAVVQRSPLGQILRREAMHFNLEIAVTRYLSNEVVREQA